MELFKRRYLMTVCAFFIASVILSANRIIPLSNSALCILTAVLSIAVTLSAFFFRRAKRILVLVGVSVLAVSLAFANVYFRGDVREEFELGAVGKGRQVKGYVTDQVYESEGYSVYSVKLVEIGGRDRLSVNAEMTVFFDAGLSPGDLFSSVCDIWSIYGGDSGYTEAEINARRADRSYLDIFPNGEGQIKVIGKVKNISLFFSSLNRYLCQRIIDLSDERGGGLVSALALGNRKNVDRDVLRDFRRSGCSHILALSGQHMAIIIGGVALSLKKWGIKRYIAIPLTVAFALFYAALSGFSMSVTRSCIMLVILYLGMLAGERTDPFTSLFFAVSLIMAFDPMSALDVGLILSFTAAFGVTVSFAAMKEVRSRTARGKLGRAVGRRLRGVIRGFVSGIFALGSMIFVMSLYFGEIWIMSPISSLILSPMLTVILLAVFPGLLLYPIIPPLGKAFIFVSSLMSKGMIAVCKSFSLLKGTSLSMRYPFAMFLTVLFLVSFASVLTVRVKNRTLIFVPFCIFCAGTVLCLGLFNISYSDRYTATYSIAGNGNESVAFSGDHKGLIVDLSRGSAAADGLGVNALKAEYISEIQVYMLTGYTKNHMVTAKKLLTSQRVRNIWLPKPEDGAETEIFDTVSKIAEEQNTRVTVYSYGRRARIFGDGEMCVIRNTDKDSDVPIITVLASVNGKKTVYTSGGMYRAEENTDALTASKDADLLILGGKGPKIREVYSPTVKSGSTVAIANGTSFDMCNRPLLFRSGARVVKCEKKFRFVF